VQEIEVKASQQAQLIHVDLSGEVAHLKRQHAKELAVVERRRVELVRALLRQVDEMSRSLEEVKTQRDLTLTDLKAAQDGQKKAKEAYEAKSQALVKKLKGTLSKLSQVVVICRNLELMLVTMPYRC
jgi:hypothetical protein